MDKSDSTEFAQIMAGLAENFNAQLSDAGLEMRFEALRKFSIGQVRAAAMNLMRFRKFTTMPTTAEFFEYLEGNPDDIALVEAAKVMGAIKAHGGVNSVAFDNPVTQAVIVQVFGGWVKLCSDTEADEEKWFLKDFAKAWKAYSQQRIEVRGHLPGWTETQNAAMGFDNLQPVKLIGDTEKALQIANRRPDVLRLDGPGPVGKLVESIGQEAV